MVSEPGSILSSSMVASLVAVSVAGSTLSSSMVASLAAVSSGTANTSFVADSVRDVGSPAYTGTEEKECCLK